MGESQEKQIEEKANKKVELVVTKEKAKQRLDKYITEQTELSRMMTQKLIQEEKIKINGNIQKSSYKVQEQDIIQIIIEQPKQSDLKPQNIPLDIIYEDNDIIVVNKSKGMVVHPAIGNPDGTLVNAIMAHCKQNLSGIGGELRPRNCTQDR